MCQCCDESCSCPESPAMQAGIRMGASAAWAQPRYLVFVGDTYYPGGGWEDFVNAVDTVEEARKIVESRTHTASGGARREGWWQIVSLTDLSVVDDGGNP